jgi:hypothetical protein
MHDVVPLDAELAAFLTSRISVQVAACDEQGFTTLVRALGARVAADRRRVTVLMARSQAEPVLAMLRANGRIAAVFSHPVSHRTVQLKGRDAAVEAATPADEAELAPYAAAMAAHLAVYDVPESFTRAMVSCPPGDLVAVSFTPCQAYGQTPGPGAGERLARGAATP